MAYNAAEQSLVNDVAWLPMNQELYIFLRKPCVQGIVDAGFGLIPPGHWANIYANIYISTDTPCAKTS